MYNNSRDKSAEHLQPEMEFLCNLITVLFIFIYVDCLTDKHWKKSVNNFMLTSTNFCNYYYYNN